MERFWFAPYTINTVAFPRCVSVILENMLASEFHEQSLQHLDSRFSCAMGHAREKKWLTMGVKSICQIKISQASSKTISQFRINTYTWCKQALTLWKLPVYIRAFKSMRNSI